MTSSWCWKILIRFLPKGFPSWDCCNGQLPQGGQRPCLGLGMGCICFRGDGRILYPEEKDSEPRKRGRNLWDETLWVIIYFLGCSIVFPKFNFSEIPFPFPHPRRNIHQTKLIKRSWTLVQFFPSRCRLAVVRGGPRGLPVSIVCVAGPALCYVEMEPWQEWVLISSGNMWFQVFGCAFCWGCLRSRMEALNC